MKKIAMALVGLVLSAAAWAQEPLKKVYNEVRDRMAQVDSALVVAEREGKYVMVQLGGNWCPWCLRFADFVERDAELKAQMSESFVYEHVNYSGAAKRLPDHRALMRRLGNPARFGFPVFIVLDAAGCVLHIQNSALLEEGQGYDKKAVQQFLQHWSPQAVETLKE